jgi:hypothetical protein
MAGVKHAPEGKCAPSRRCNVTDLEMKTRKIRKWEGEQGLSAIAWESGSVVSSVNSITQYATHIKEHVKGTAMMKLMIITKKLDQSDPSRICWIIHVSKFFYLPTNNDHSGNMP